MSFALLVKGAMVLARISGMILLMPVFSAIGIPRLVRALAALFLTVVIAPVVPDATPVATLPDLVAGMFSEFVVGIAMGATVYVAFASINIAAEIMSQQLGLMAAQWFDPMFKESQSALGRLCYWLAAMVFLGSNLHLSMFKAVADSFASIPPGTAISPGLLAPTWPYLVSATMAAGVRLAGPVIILSFLIHAFLAILARLSSTLNAFMSIGLITTLAGGGLILGLSFPGILRAHADFVQSFVNALVPLANLVR